MSEAHMKLSRRERDKIKLEIQNESVLLGRVRRYVQVGGAIALFAVLVIVLFFKGSWNAPKIILTVVAVLAGLFTIISLISYYNGRKHLLSQINYLDQNK